jgi:hypothetical protein
MSTQISNPLDVIKTRLQTQGEIGGKLGIAQTVRLVYSEGGFGAFFRGLGARMLYHAPAAAFQMVTYEAVKVRLRRHSGIRDMIIVHASPAVECVFDFCFF